MQRNRRYADCVKCSSFLGGGQIYNDKTLTKAGPQASDHVTTLKEKKTAVIFWEMR